MKKTWKKWLSFVLAVIMIACMLPTTVFAAVDSTGRPKDVNNTLVLAIYTGEGFPGEPAVYGTSNYKKFNSKFEVGTFATFASSANKQLDWAKIDPDLVQGQSSGNTSVWGVYDTTGAKDYFLEDASIIKPENEAKMIRAIKTELKNASDEEVLSQYEIIWYVIKLQHNSRGFLGITTTEWHVDGVIKEKEKISINYYGNGNTDGDAPLGTAAHTAGDPYTVLDKNTMTRKINGVEVAFLGWSAKADGTGAEAGFYQPGDVINPEESISLYAMWDTTTQYTATVNTYLDGEHKSAQDIHSDARELFLSTDNVHFHALTEESTGVYKTNITGNGKFHLYHKEPDGTYAQIGTYQLTIYNQNAQLDIHHYSVSYDPNGGSLASSQSEEIYFYGSAVNAISEIPVKDGYRFLGWEADNGDLIMPGNEVTSYIAEAITLTAKWEKTVNVTVNVTIDHKGDNDGYDRIDTRNNLFLSLVSRENAASAYLETGDTLTLNGSEQFGFDFSETDYVTTYIANAPTFTNMPGGTAEYTVVTSKSNYDVKSVEATQDANGDWTINVSLKFNPTNFDINFTVEIDESVPDQYIPNSAIVKVTFWDGESWKIITQQEGNGPGVRVDIDPETRSGSGSYPVWKYESGGTVPYGYRIEVRAFVYPDGTIVRADNTVIEAVEWSDNVYTATVDEEIGGQTYGTLNGAYYSNATEKQEGTLNAVITIDLHDVTFDAMGGTVNGESAQLVEDQYKVPSFNGYIPVRDGGYIFSGWYENEACTIPATEGKDLTEDITLYAKWIAPLTISGTVTISGTYMQDGEKISVHGIDRATEAVVVLQEIRNGIALDVDSVFVNFGEYEDLGSDDYIFTGIPNDGKEYRIYVLELNYGTKYDNNADESFGEGEYKAIFGDNNIADVDAFLEFVPPSYDQILNVDATQIGEDFRPESVLSEVLYRDTGANHAFQRISQHSAAPNGVQIALNAGIGSGSESIWKWHTDGTLYDYQMNITKVDGAAFDSDEAPFYIIYDAPAYWDANADAPSAELKATLIPKQYPVIFDLNAGEDTVTGMDAYWNEEDQAYETVHTWSFATEINATPAREGYTFLGWEADVADAYDGSAIAADVHQDVVLTAKWAPIPVGTVTTVADVAEGGTTAGDGTYVVGTNVTVSATVNKDYQFEGWYENGEKVSDDAEYAFTVKGDHNLTAKFTKIPKKTFTIVATANPADGGSVSGAGTYEEGTEITLSATTNEGYTFVGWYGEKGELVSAEAEFKHTVTENRVFKARYNMISEYTNNYAYIFGYTDTVMGAEGPLRRSEAAVMIHRLVKQNNERGDFVYDSANPSFKDIAGEWFQCGIEFLHYKGAFTAAEGTNVRPYVQITRGEVFRLVALGLGFTDDTTLTHDEYGNLLKDRGYIIGSSGSGYLDSDSLMTRAEFCTMYNRIIGRENALLVDANGNKITHETYGFTDLSPDKWYYEAMLRATSAYDENGYVDLSKRAIRNVVDDYS